MKQWMKRLWRDESGQDLTEYALLLVLIALASIAAMSGLANAVKNIYGSAQNSITNSTP